MLLRFDPRRGGALRACRVVLAASALAACGEGSIESVARSPISGGGGDTSHGAGITVGGDTTATSGTGAPPGAESGAGGSSSNAGSAGASMGATGSSGVGVGGASVGRGGAGGAGSSAAATTGAAGGPTGRAGAGGAGGAPGGAGTTTGAWRPFSDTSPWNTPIPQVPAIDPDSAALVADLAASTAAASFWINIQQYSIPVYWASSSTALQKMSVTVLAGQGFGTGAPGSAMIPVPAGAAPAAGTDRHLCIIDKQAQTEWGMWDTSNGAGWSCSVAATSDLSGTGVRPPKTGNPTWWTSPGARACGFPLVAGLITVEEMQKGKIEHALVIAYPHMRSHFYKTPASTAQPTTDLALPTRGIPCGGRVQLDPTVDVNQLALSASGKIIARALQEYGAYVGDFSGAVSLYADASADAQSAWNAGLLKNGEIGALDLKKLRVLSMGALFEDTN